MGSDIQFERGLDFLEENGINLVAVLDLNNLSSGLLSDVKTKNYQRLVLLGHAGRTLWNRLKDQDKGLFDSSAPIDLFSCRIVVEVAETYWGSAKIELLYPNASAVPLQQLGEIAGWHHDSPMGVGINKEHGLWFAYRALFLVDNLLPLTLPVQSSSPCESCFDSPCIEACPANALSSSAGIEIRRCSQFRIKKHSACEDRCLARECCPAAFEQRYDREQISYHYLHSLAVVKEYYP
jgi:hypothetical protein